MPTPYAEIARTIIKLKEADLALRDQLIIKGQLGEGYHPEMARIHDENAAVLAQIIEKIGFPTAEKVGPEASEASFLVIQHAIGQPAFMRKCLSLLQTEVAQNKASAKHLAYLTDRIASFEGRAQQYGTQFDWDEHGLLSPIPYDDLEKVNERRKTIGLNSLEEQTALIRRQANREKQSPPKDLVERKQEMDAWRRRVGWIL